MSKRLLACAVGPVQELIAAARRTRDLWYGSWLLSDISRAVASSLAESCGAAQLIFPAAESLQSPDTGVANVIVVEVPADKADSIEAIVQAAQTAAESQWKHRLDSAWQHAARRITSESQLSGDIRDKQQDDVVEFYAAWVPLDDDYKSARRRVTALLAGRKQCRTFNPTIGFDGVPKSSLDGARESVIANLDAVSRGRLRIREGEQLDCIGLTKRVGGGTRPYPSVSRVAADSWIRGLRSSAALREFQSRLMNTFNQLRDIDNEPVVHPVSHPAYKDFPWDGAILFESRHQEIAEQSGLTVNDLRPVRSLVADITRRHMAPDQYLAVLLADGDGVGAALSKMQRADEHRSFSARLAEFATQAGEIMTLYSGVLIYSGGDDILGFVPVDNAIPCAGDLRTTFAECMAQAVPDGVAPPTLSAGIAIGHFLEPLEYLLDYARTAEHHAKQGDRIDATDRRNALAIHVHPRGGSPIRIRSQWDALRGHLTLPQRIELWLDVLQRQEISHRTPYQLHNLSREFDHWPTTTTAECDDLKEAIQAMVALTVGRKRGASGDAGAEHLAQLIDTVHNANELRTLSEELLVARRIFQSVRCANPAVELQESET